MFTPKKMAAIPLVKSILPQINKKMCDTRGVDDGSTEAKIETFDTEKLGTEDN